MEYCRDYKSILSTQLNFVNYILSDIVLNYNKYGVDNAIKHVNNCVYCEVSDDLITVVFGEVYGYLRFSSDRKSIIDSFYNMKDVGLDETSYCALMKEITSKSEDDLVGSQYYRSEMEDSRKYILCYVDLMDGKEVVVSSKR